MIRPRKPRRDPNVRDSASRMIRGSKKRPHRYAIPTGINNMAEYIAAFCLANHLKE